MIIFQAFDDWQIDLTSYGLTFNETSDIFYAETQKSFTFPIQMDIDEEIASNFGLVNLENIRGYKIRIDGYIFVDDIFYDAYMIINEVYDLKAELQFFYGAEVLSVFDKKLSELTFPVISANENFKAHFNDVIGKKFPEVGHSFPMYIRPQIAQRDKYQNFEGFVNNYIRGGVIINSAYLEDGETVPDNRNVVSPAPYILEILRVGFAMEGKEIRGEFVDDDLFKSAVIIPKNFFENYSNTIDRDFHQFYFATDVETVNGKNVNVFQKTFDVRNDGFFRLKIKLNFPKGLAEYFDLKVTRGNEELFSIFIENSPLAVDKTVFILVPESETYQDVVATLKLSEQANSIATMNSFEFTKDGGDVNTYPNEYSLADFVPNMTFREYFNALKKWLSLDVTFYENAVYLDYLNNTIRTRIFDDHSNLEDPGKRRTLNKRNLFKIFYEEDDPIYVNKDGLVYSDAGYNQNEIENLEFDFLPIKIGASGNFISGVYPEEEPDKILVGMYDGLVTGYPFLKKAIGAKSLNLSNIYTNFHRYFLSFRANAEQYKDTFLAHVAQKFDLKNGIFKYNKKQMIKSVRKRRVSEEYWQVDQEAESF
ncbi:hypothetical protein LCGC14_0502670 [marine sediment metagenome]|uniref:Uncharacterized protein n=2 Tax=root TaxID=1 RepID=A0A831VLR5_9FLAO|nr:hypothetical protein [Pricia antarctica]